MPVSTDTPCPVVDADASWRRDIGVDDVGFENEFWFSWTDQSPDLPDVACIPRGYATPALELWCRVGADVMRAGYLKLSCGTPNLAELTPTVFHWANLRAGWSVNVDDPVKLWQTAHSYACRAPASSLKQPYWSAGEPPSDADVLAADIAALAKHLKRRFAKQRRIADTLAATHVVAFSRLGEHWKGRGLGQLMYHTCARELAVRRSAALVSSSTQSSEAMALWERLSVSDRYRLQDLEWSSEPRPSLDYAK